MISFTGPMIMAAKMPFDVMMQQMSEGMVKTTGIFLLTLLFSLPLGLIVAFGRMSKNKIISFIVKLYISVMRGTPLMLQLMVVYFGPNILLGIRNAEFRFTAVIIAFSLNYAAYFAEIYRSGIEAMNVGQYEAASLLGYNKAQTFIKIICPQVIKIILPSVTNEIICLVKDTSLAFAISYQEMFTKAKIIVASQASLTPFIIAGVFYYVFNLIVAGIMGYFEKKMNYYR